MSLLEVSPFDLDLLSPWHVWANLLCEGILVGGLTYPDQAEFTLDLSARWHVLANLICMFTTL